MPQLERVAFFRECRKLWIGTAVAWVAGIIALMVTLAKRSAGVGELGSMSNHWIDEHPVDSP